MNDEELQESLKCFPGKGREELLQILRERSSPFDVQRAAMSYKGYCGIFGDKNISFGIKPNNLTDFLHLFDDTSKCLLFKQLKYTGPGAETSDCGRTESASWCDTGTGRSYGLRKYARVECSRCGSGLRRENAAKGEITDRRNELCAKYVRSIW